jgi:hypothetical protein
MGFHKGSKLRPVSDFVTMAWVRILFGLHISRFGFSASPKVNGAATDMKDFYGFIDRHAIQLDSLYHFAAQVIAIRLGHGTNRRRETFLDYVLMQLATAIHRQRLEFGQHSRTATRVVPDITHEFPVQAFGTIRGHVGASGASVV